MCSGQPRAVPVAAWMVLFAMVACSRVDRDLRHTAEAVHVLCEGEWTFTLELGGLPSAPRGFEHLSIEIDERVPLETALQDPLVTYARGTVAWNGVSWPMTIHFGPYVNWYCRYADGHPFLGTADPNGFSFQVLTPEGGSAAPGRLDQLLVDHDLRLIREPGVISTASWYCYSRAEP